MAQPVFDDHPLEEYLRDAGEAPDLLPGGSTDFALHNQDTSDDYEPTEFQQPSWLQSLVSRAVETIGPFLDTESSSKTNFVERFKYSVISSSLLSTSLPYVSNSARRPASPFIPGKLTHSRNASDESRDIPLPPPPAPSSHDSSVYWPYAVVIALFGLSLYSLAVIVLAASLYYTFFYHSDSTVVDTKPYIDTLQQLITANDVWESVVQEAVSTLEHEETSIYSTTPSSPSSPLRVALHSSLLTTQTQCDNVRHIFAALTSPSNLAQISEMYAPPSPQASNLPLSPSRNTYFERPLSLPTASVRKRTTSVPTQPSDKRMTWNGSYSSLAKAGSPSAQAFKRREKRRSDISALLQVTPPTLKSVSAPVTPAEGSPLDNVEEEGNNSEDEAYPDLPDSSAFGAAALDLRRKRRSGGLDALGINTAAAPRSLPSSQLTTPTKRRSMASPLSPGLASKRPISTPSPLSFASASRFTTLHRNRHPLSLSSLHFALQGALAAKRYSCSHLLALRFSDEFDEGYWEDVRSVIALLTSALVDASARLESAMEDAEKRKLMDQTPTPNPSKHVRRRSLSVGDEASTTPSAIPLLLLGSSGLFDKRRRTSEGIGGSSFAPMPSALTRFATHVDAISTALNDARDNLEACIQALRDDPSHTGRCTTDLDRLGHQASSSIGSSSVDEDTMPALLAYERLRRELGLALRECERGRERLIDLVRPESDDSADLPALNPDGGSDDSDKHDDPRSDDEEPNRGHPTPAINFSTATDDDEGIFAPERDDDASAHLLLSTMSQHLPAPGVEQVFEAESEDRAAFRREKSKLSREERIRLAKERRRESGNIRTVGENSPGGGSGWNLGGDVVQELKDVIWEVGKKRQRLAEESGGVVSTTPLSPPPSDVLQTRDQSLETS